MKEKVEPCIGCGFCCRQAPCAMAVRIHGPIEKCPELVYYDGRWWCRAIENARGPLADQYRQAVAIGGGCSSTLCNQDRVKIPTPEDIAQREREARGGAEPIDYRRLFHHVCRSLGQPFMMSGDGLYVIARQIQKDIGQREARAFLYAVRENRDSQTEEFMGGTPTLAEENKA